MQRTPGVRVTQHSEGLACWPEKKVKAMTHANEVQHTDSTSAAETSVDRHAQAGCFLARSALPEGHCCSRPGGILHSRKHNAQDPT